MLTSRAMAAEAPVGLGTAESYSVLGGQTVTNTGPSTLSGDLGVSPGTAITGFPPGLAAGSTHAGDAVALQAQADLVVAYDDAAGRAPTADVAGDLVGQTLTGGVYKSTGPLALGGTLTLDAQGDPNTVWIFQIASTLITATASSVALINGAQACRVYWQVGSSATLGTTSTFRGTIMALTSITVTTGTTVEGRALARNGQVSLDDNTFTTPGCATGPPTSTTSPTPPPTDTPPTTTSTSGDSTTTPGTTTSAGPTTNPGGGFPGDEDDGGPENGGPFGQGPDSPTYVGDLADTGIAAPVGRLIGFGVLLLTLGGLLVAALNKSRARRHG
ncbi:ice-binding family protein [Actinokineospora pegani]|uniref:ice-binding family protein n=1 Tax=Actinokineospora pegani TaxID=2654637 RepID=UPI0018D4684E|nr:ice-binding family protein [Actinokineospora pegani]